MALIYIVEDDQNIREIESFALKNSGYRVMDFECAKDFYKKIGEKVPQLILLDIMLPDEDGLDVVRKLRGMPETRKVPIILVTAKTTEIDKVKGLDIGADDYITKPIKPKLLVSKVKALLRRLKEGNEQDSETLNVGGIEINREEYKIIKDEIEIALPRKEFELFYLRASKPGKVFKRDEILDKVWRNEVIVGGRTIDVHIRKLREKIGEEFFKTIKGVGYKFEV